MFGQTEDEDRQRCTKDAVGSITCEDLELLLSCCEDSLQLVKPEIFSSYIKIMNYIHEIELDCQQSLPPFFEPGEKIPIWAQQAQQTFKTDLNSGQWN